MTCFSQNLVVFWWCQTFGISMNSISVVSENGSNFWHPFDLFILVLHFHIHFSDTVETFNPLIFLIGPFSAKWEEKVKGKNHSKIDFYKNRDGLRIFAEHLGKEDCSNSIQFKALFVKIPETNCMRLSVVEVTSWENQQLVSTHSFKEPKLKLIFETRITHKTDLLRFEHRFAQFHITILKSRCKRFWNGDLVW